MKQVEFIWQSSQSKDFSKFFGFHWLKSVVGFNDNKHCKHCLVGLDCKDLPRYPSSNIVYKVKLQEHRDEIIPPHTHKGEIIHYYCFVSDPYVWARNLHIPFIYKEGSVASVDKYGGDKIIIRNAEFLPFDNVKTNALYGHLDRFFTTCRNFQFAVDYFK